MALRQIFLRVTRLCSGASTACAVRRIVREGGTTSVFSCSAHLPACQRHDPKVRQQRGTIEHASCPTSLHVNFSCDPPNSQSPAARQEDGRAEVKELSTELLRCRGGADALTAHLPLILEMRGNLAVHASKSRPGREWCFVVFSFSPGNEIDR